MTEISELQDAVEEMTDAAERIEEKLKTSRIIQWIIGGVSALCLVTTIGLVIVVVVLVNLLTDFRDANIAGCERANKLREDTIELTTNDYESFSTALQRITGATTSERDELIRFFEEERDIPASFIPVDCEDVY